VFIVVPVKEGVRPCTGILHTAKAIRVRGMIFDGLELGFAEGIIIRDIGTSMAFFDAQITQQQRQGFGFHGFAVIGMER
jgi:hypothetical protein